jgi:hypothetical protein
MARFTTRVELNGEPSAKNYSDLHLAMKSKGFSRFITSDDGKKYHLPSAEYNREGDVTRQQVLDDAKAAAKSVWNSVQVIVTEGPATWNGLREATIAELRAS